MLRTASLWSDHQDITQTPPTPCKSTCLSTANPLHSTYTHTLQAASMREETVYHRKKINISQSRSFISPSHVFPPLSITPGTFSRQTSSLKHDQSLRSITADSVSVFITVSIILCHFSVRVAEVLDVAPLMVLSTFIFLYFMNLEISRQFCLSLKLY